MYSRKAISSIPRIEAAASSSPVRVVAHRLRPRVLSVWAVPDRVRRGGHHQRGLNAAPPVVGAAPCRRSRRREGQHGHPAQPLRFGNRRLRDVGSAIWMRIVFLPWPASMRAVGLTEGVACGRLLPDGSYARLPGGWSIIRRVRWSANRVVCCRQQVPRPAAGGVSLAGVRRCRSGSGRFGPRSFCFQPRARSAGQVHDDC